MQDQQEIKAEQTKQINQNLSFILVMLGLSVVIGVLGIANTLALSTFERTRELGLLRAVGHVPSPAPVEHQMGGGAHLDGRHGARPRPRPDHRFGSRC